MMRHTRQSVSRDIMDDIECERQRKYEKMPCATYKKSTNKEKVPCVAGTTARHKRIKSFLE